MFTIPDVACPYSALYPPVITSTSWIDPGLSCNPKPVPPRGSWTETPSRRCAFSDVLPPRGSLDRTPVEQVRVRISPPAADVNLVVRLHDSGLHRDDILDALHRRGLDILALDRAGCLRFFEVEERFLSDNDNLLPDAEHRFFHLDFEVDLSATLDLYIRIFHRLIPEE